MKLNRSTLALAVLLAAVAGGGWFFVDRFEIDGLSRLKLKSRPEGESGWRPLPPAGESGPIKIATFNVKTFGEAKLSKPEVVAWLIDVVRRFDIVALQEIRSKDQRLVPEFLAAINRDGGHYDFELGPRLGRSSSREQYAFLFNAARVEIDRSAVYTVNDPDDLLHREPLVAAFRVRGPPPEQAFTFTLINVHTDPDETKTELAALDDVFRAVRADGRDEDDIVLLGDFNVDSQHLGELGWIAYLSQAVPDSVTNTRGTKQYDHIVFQGHAAVEFTGRSGVFDLVRELNITFEQALEISDHQPVWAEFTAEEGGDDGRLAEKVKAGSREE